MFESSTSQPHDGEIPHPAYRPVYHHHGSSQVLGDPNMHAVDYHGGVPLYYGYGYGSVQPPPPPPSQPSQVYVASAPSSSVSYYVPSQQQQYHHQQYHHHQPPPPPPPAPLPHAQSYYSTCPYLAAQQQQQTMPSHPSPSPLSFGQLYGVPNLTPGGGLPLGYLSTTTGSSSLSWFRSAAPADPLGRSEPVITGGVFFLPHGSAAPTTATLVVATLGEQTGGYGTLSHGGSVPQPLVYQQQSQQHQHQSMSSFPGGWVPQQQSAAAPPPPQQQQQPPPQAVLNGLPQFVLGASYWTEWRNPHQPESIFTMQVPGSVFGPRLAQWTQQYQQEQQQRANAVATLSNNHNNNSTGRSGRSSPPDPPASGENKTTLAKRKMIQSILRDPNLSQSEKNRRVQSLMSGGGNASTNSAGGSNDSDQKPSSSVARASKQSSHPRDTPWAVFSFCPHYERKLDIVAPCCDRVFACHLCHNDRSAPGHETMETEAAVREIVCRYCRTRQGVSNQCVRCQSLFADYHCGQCKVWMSKLEKPFHCSDCGLCRVGGADSIRHCHDCSMCIPNIIFGKSHKCMRDKYKSDCPICLEDLFTSRRPLADLPCGHPIHFECIQNHIRTDYRCPLCKKTALDDDVIKLRWKHQAREIAANPLPSRLSRYVLIYCHDCEAKDQRRPFHFLGIQCAKCCSFNTTITQDGNRAATASG